MITSVVFFSQNVYFLHCRYERLLVLLYPCLKSLQSAHIYLGKKYFHKIRKMYLKPEICADSMIGKVMSPCKYLRYSFKFAVSVIES